MEINNTICVERNKIECNIIITHSSIRGLSTVFEDLKMFYYPLSLLNFLLEYRSYQTLNFKSTKSGKFCTS